MFNKDMTRGAVNSASCAPVGVAGTTGEEVAPVQAARPAIPFRMPLGEWFDEDFDFKGAEGDAFTEALLVRIAEVEERIRKRKAVDEESHRLLVRKLAVNGYRAFRWFKPPRLSVRLGPKAYNGRGGPWLNGEAMGREIDFMARAGLVEISGGVWGEASTTLRFTEAFVIEAMNAKLSDGNVIHRLDADRTVRVYRTNSEDGEFVDFEHDDQSRNWIAQLDAYNAFLAEQKIGIELSKAETTKFVARQNGYRQAGTPRLKQPDLTNKSLFRQFNYGGFEAGGRLYGAWWVNCPSDLRPLITINGEATVELDFSGCSIRMLYHRNNKPFEGDVYGLEAVDAFVQAKGLPPKRFRPGIKRLAQVLFNSDRNVRPEEMKLKGDERVRPWFTEARVVAMLREKHAPIAHEFQSEAWKWTQRQDSEIALTVISNLMEKGIVALSIHDSFIVIDGEEDLLIEEMNNCYLDKFSFLPEID
ncbi:hypothetical protein Sphch_0744 [Sphingobium chlorophenolicum L-1]|uniref:Uncharacterized protein n=1 Tax=Sphingobium chlorophenolicum L-1 TaxID=690566 RepID=F6EZG3_SPHCR|nr:hypothetical protein [Sphingobium chlorophenolicum]AEG48439.1 hypothetical protein Sphch_0744 [Sphingobium chlorophenolicum L-1]